MYLRLVQRKLKKESLAVAKKIYDTKAIPIFREVDGCIFAGLILDDTKIGSAISMTLWTDKKKAETYEKSGVHQQILDIWKDLIEDTEEMKMQLSQDFKLEYKAVKRDPEVKAFEVVTPVENDLDKQEITEHMHLRILSVNLRKDKKKEFEDLYNSVIISELKKQEGCILAFFTENQDDENNIISVTIWNRKEDAEAYEKTGKFSELIKKVDHTFTEMTRWKMSLDEKAGKRAAVSEELRTSSSTPSSSGAAADLPRRHRTPRLRTIALICPATSTERAPSIRTAAPSCLTAGVSGTGAVQVPAPRPATPTPAPGRTRSRSR